MSNLIYKITAFSDSADGGNLAGVVLDADLLSEEEMLIIAKEIGYSETAFVMKSNNADFKVRFFTTVDEVDLCGHATIATFNLLRDLGKISTGAYTQETKAGILKLEINDKEVYMEQNIPIYYEIIEQKEIAECFNSADSHYVADLPIQIVSTGLKDIILPIKNLKLLLSLKPNLEVINTISEKYDVTGIHAFSLDEVNKGNIHVRNFAPRYGIDEESATGTSNGALACYLTKYLKNQYKGQFEMDQGFSMNRPSKIKVRISLTDEGEVSEVYVGGRAVLIG